MTLLEIINFKKLKRINEKTFDKWKCQPHLSKTTDLVASKNSQQHLFKVVLYKKKLILDSLFHAKAAR